LTEERERKRVINPVRLICVYCPSLLTGVAEDNGICKTERERKWGLLWLSNVEW
jgi:hypothetical protein